MFLQRHGGRDRTATKQDEKAGEIDRLTSKGNRKNTLNSDNRRQKTPSPPAVNEPAVAAAAEADSNENPQKVLTNTNGHGPYLFSN